MTVKAICRRAEELGLSAIAITDHVYEPEGRAVIEKIKADLAAASPKLKVYVGVEVDVDADYTDGRLVTDSLDGLDIVTAGFHYVPTAGNYPKAPHENPLAPTVFMDYWQASLLGIVSNPKVDVLAHPGRLLASAVDLDVYFDAALGVFEKAAALSAKNKIAWELNELTGYRLSPFWQEQWHRIYRIALDAGVPLVYGSDAHAPEAIGVHTFVDMVRKKLPEHRLARPEEIAAGVLGKRSQDTSERTFISFENKHL
ncbi:MAG: PHP domain-containing protein [Planctomycetales bacterium]|nr:PHP domain-containing protein [Planctomycetales bacterium]